jgi:hypothetical protein
MRAASAVARSGWWTLGSESEIRSIYLASLANLSAAVSAFEVVEIYDNSVPGRIPRLVARSRAGTTTLLTPDRIEWLARAIP